MKKFLVFLLILTGSLIMLSSAQAVPKLQIYIPGAYYDMDSETWIINSYDYELWVIGSSDVIKDVKIALAVPEGEDENGSIKVDWTDTSIFGSTITMTESGGLDYSENQANYTERRIIDDEYLFGVASEGEYPLNGDGKEIPGHGVFPTDFYEYYIGDFGLTQEVYNYNPPDGYTGESWIPDLVEIAALDAALGEVKKFDISVSGYTWVDIVAYDHWVGSNSKAKYVFSPFSHDGAGGGTNAPEPATMLLFGLGLLGLAGIGRRQQLLKD